MNELKFKPAKPSEAVWLTLFAPPQIPPEPSAEDPAPAPLP